MKDLILNIRKKLFKNSQSETSSELPEERLYPSLDYLNPERKSKLEKVLKIPIKKIEYFEQALTHRSYLQVEPEKVIYSNERLEFLGDSVLNLIIADYLFSMHTNVMEGELTKMRSWLVNKNTLADVGKTLKLGDFILMSFSASKAVEKGSDSIYADAVESIIGAIFIDSGFPMAKKFIYNTILPIIVQTHKLKDNNYKSLLLETVQASGKPAPTYSVIEERGPDHEKEFIVGVYVEDLLMGSGTGRSKKQAEQTAAEEALQKLNKDKENNYKENTEILNNF